MTARRNGPYAKADTYRHLYNTVRWRDRSAAQRDAEPLCCMCLATGRVEPATVADHVIPHRGDSELFWNGKLQSLCKPHHDSRKKAEERRGYVIGCDAKGRPLDVSHPWNARTMPETAGDDRKNEAVPRPTTATNP